MLNSFLCQSATVSSFRSFHELIGLKRPLFSQDKLHPVTHLHLIVEPGKAHLIDFLLFQVIVAVEESDASRSEEHCGV